MSCLQSEVFGHERLFTAWKKLISSQQLEGTFLFIGVPGIGKIKAAYAMIQAALCEKKLGVACGECGPCLRVQNRQHESLLHIQASGTMIKVESAHEILQFCQLQSLSKKRFVLIEEAEKMNLQTANILLKTLEEPPHGTVFILTSSSSTSVISTIKSRSKVFKFNPVSPQEMLDQNLGPEWAVFASQGRFDRLQSLTDPQNQIQRKNALQILTQILVSPNFLTDDFWRESLKSREDLKAYLELWLGLIRDAIYLQLNEQNSLVHADLKSEIVRIATFDARKLDWVFTQLLDLQKHLNFNKDAVLSLESLYIQSR